jgi:hypothetical protein
MKRTIFVPQTGQTPCIAARPLSILTCLASLMSRFSRHFTQ